MNIPKTLGEVIANIERRGEIDEADLAHRGSLATGLLLEAIDIYMLAVRRHSNADSVYSPTAWSSMQGAETRLRAAMELARVTSANH